MVLRLPLFLSLESTLLTLLFAVCYSTTCLWQLTPPSSRGLGHLPFTEATGIRIPLGVIFLLESAILA